MDEDSLAKMVKSLSSGKRYASASCDFAQMIWSSLVTDQKQSSYCRQVMRMSAGQWHGLCVICRLTMTSCDI